MPSKSTVFLAVVFVVQAGAPLLVAQNPAQDASGRPGDGTVSTQTAKANTPTLQERYPRYQLLSGDTMDLVFEFSPEFNQTVTVQPDGFISLRGVGDVHVSSETLPQLISTLQTSYSKILSEPAISGR